MIVQRPRRFLTAAAIATLLGSGAVVAEAEEMTARAVIERSLEALGGAESWSEVDTLELTGTFATFSSSQPFHLWRKRPDLYRFEHQEADRPLTIGFDGETVWWENHTPFSEVTWPAEPPEVYSRGYRADALFEYPFLRPEEKGHQVELIGRTDYEGIDSYELRVTLADGTTETWYLDADSFLPAARVAPAGFKDFETTQRVFFSDFRPVAGILVPFHVESELNNLYRVMQVDEVEAGGEIDDSLFEFPRPPVMARLGKLVGEWEVAVASRFLPPLPWTEDRATATFTSRYHGRVIEERISYLSAGHPRSVQRIYSYDRFRDVLRVVQVDDLTAHPNLLEGDPEADPLTVTNLGTGTEWTVRGQAQYDRLVLDLLPGHPGFQVELDRSPDGGESWATLTRFRYLERRPPESGDQRP